MKVKPVNIVASVQFNMQGHVGLMDLAERLKLRYHPELFPGAVYKAGNGATILIFSTMKAVCTGCRSVEQVYKAVSELKDRLLDVGVRVDTPLIRIVNIVARVKFYFEVDLDRAGEVLPHALYEPERFPGLILRVNKHGWTALIFRNGETIILGAKSMEEVEKAAQTIRRMLVECDVAIFT